MPDVAGGSSDGAYDNAAGFGSQGGDILGNGYGQGTDYAGVAMGIAGVIGGVTSILEGAPMTGAVAIAAGVATIEHSGGLAAIANGTQQSGLLDAGNIGMFESASQSMGTGDFGGAGGGAAGGTAFVVWDAQTGSVLYYDPNYLQHAMNAAYTADSGQGG